MLAPVAAQLAQLVEQPPARLAPPVSSVVRQHINCARTPIPSPAPFHLSQFVGAGRPLVLERAAVEAARERIKARYNVTEEQNLPAS